MATSKLVELISSDGETFEVEEAMVLESQILKKIYEDTNFNGPISLVDVSSKILMKIIEFCKYHLEKRKTSKEKYATPKEEIVAWYRETETKAWCKEFMKVDQTTLFDIVAAANFLNIPGLLWVSCEAVADMVRACGESMEEVRMVFNIKEDRPPEEVEKERELNSWAFMPSAF